MEGYVKLFRSITENWVWDDKPFSRGQAWIDLLILANHADARGISKGRPVEYKAGTVHYSILSLADRWGWSRKKTTRFIDCLEADGMLSRKSTPNGTTLTIENYGFYQGWGTTKEQQKNNGSTTEAQQKHTNKNDKNDKNEKKIYKPKPNRFNTFESRQYPDSFFDALERGMSGNAREG